MAQQANTSALNRANGAANNNQGGTKPGETKQACPVFDVIVMVAGTVDPTNNFATKDKMAQSYEGAAHDPRFRKQSGKDNNYYWDGNEDFINPIVEFQKQYDHVHYFGDHAWSGDNCKKNREIVGKLLGDWLCGAAGMKCALPAYLNRKVSFHFIGHSHGGNVTNEFTKSIARNAKWPAQWKVKSVVYLSTPFFQTIHKPNVAKFHGKAKICNVWCNYDLTQTAIADFSLRQLTRVTEVIVDAHDSLMKPINRLVNFDVGCLKALIGVKVKVKWDWLNTSVDARFTMDPTEARNLYDKVLAAIKDIKLIFDKVKEMVLQLNKFVDTRISEPFLKHDIQEKRKIISDPVKDKIIAELDAVLAGITPTENAFKARIASGVYSRKGFIADVKVEALVLPLIALLDVNPGSLRGKVPDLLFEAFKEQIEVFDDTLATCDHLYKLPIIPVDVTTKDDYYGLRDPQFYSLKRRLIAAEVAYMGNQIEYNFIHMLFLLAANLEMLHKMLVTAEEKTNFVDKWILDKWEYFDDDSSFYVNMRHLTRIAKAWFLIFNTRYVGGIEVDQPPRKPVWGSIMYLAQVSHSVSRQKLYPDVDKFLRGQFDSHEVKPKR